VLVEVITPISENAVVFLAWPATFADDGPAVEIFDQQQQLGDIVAVAAGQPDRQGMPLASTNRWCLEPVRARSTGDGPVRSPPKDIESETLRRAVRQVEADSGKRGDLLTSQEREEIKKLRRENFELRRANEILKSASVFFAKELDPDRTK
jgi:transposase